MTPRTGYDRELEDLKNDLSQMGEMITCAIERSFAAFENCEPEVANKVVKEDENINALEKTIEAKCFRLIIRQQPIASDLRLVSTALKVVTDMERIGDQAADIAELMERASTWNGIRPMDEVCQMMEVTRKMVQDAVDAFVSQDTDSAVEIIARDDVVDDYFSRVKTSVVVSLQGNCVHPDYAVDMLLVAKYLERIGDHAVNLCEWTQYALDGLLDHIK